MKKINKYLLAAASGLVLIGLSNCTKKAETLDLGSTSTPTPVLNTSVLTVFKATTTPTVMPQGPGAWTSSIADQPEWNPKNVKPLTVTGTVPDLGNNTFTGYVGNSSTITMQAQYDANYLYLLVQFTAAQHNAMTAQWYYNPKTKLWAQEATAAALTNLNPDGSYRPPFAQDEIVIMWNISCSTFNALSCYAACHVQSSYGGTTTPAGGYMATNGNSERLDVWRVRMAQTVPLNQLNDCFIDNGASVASNGQGSDAGVLDKNMVHSDWQTLNGPGGAVPSSLQSPGVVVATGVAPVADGGFGNKQTLKISNKTSVKEAVPIFVNPNNTYTNGGFTGGAYILPSDTGTKALRVVSVDSMGVLTLANGATVDPTTATSGLTYQQIGTVDGPGCIPGSVAALYTGSRADVTANAYPASNGWQVLFKRALNTNQTPSLDNVNDVDFSSNNSFSDLGFGIGVMFNGADNQHAIVAGLSMHFQK